MNFYKKDPNYFLSYFRANVLFFGIGLFFLILFRTITFSYRPELLLLIPLGIVFGLIVATAFHNASHGNIKPRFLNNVIGEFCGAWTLDGMRNFRVGHMLHHIHTDDPDEDPHPPLGLSFFEFIKTSKDRTIAILIKNYFRYHGENEESKKNIANQIKTYKVSVILKIIFIFYFLGPTIFIFFYLPSFLSYFFGFAQLNYISHQPDTDGNVVVKNHKDGVYFKVMNFFTSGGYYHKNHHLYPTLYNPSKITEKQPIVLMGQKKSISNLIDINISEGQI